MHALLTAGADANRRNGLGETPLMQAAAHPAAELFIAELLRHRADPDARSNDGRNALMAAAAAGQRQAVEALLAAGVDVEGTDHEGWTPLAHAAARNHWAIIEDLVHRGARVNRTFANGESPAWVAANRHQADTLTLLLRLGADPQHRHRGVSMIEMLEDDLSDRPSPGARQCLAVLRRYLS